MFQFKAFQNYLFISSLRLSSICVYVCACSSRGVVYVRQVQVPRQTNSIYLASIPLYSTGT